MQAGINVLSIWVSNGLGVLLLITLLASNYWRLQNSTKENKIFIALLALVAVTCLDDIAAFTCDGQPGALCYAVVYISNFWLYVMNILLSLLWLRFICVHLSLRLTKSNAFLIIALNVVAVILLVMNFFNPIVFGVKDTNVYFRGPFYYYFAVIGFILLVDSIALYHRAYVTGGLLKTFPIWVFVIPISIGIALQSVFYGTSLIWPCAAISLAGIAVTLQNEIIFRDHLTGLYNRFYLDFLKKKLDKHTKGIFAFIMLDINNFKGINDNFGHSEGDRALVDVADVLLRVTGSKGSVIRYAGDEFVVILNTAEEKLASRHVEDINQAFKDFNESNKREYELSASIGYCLMDLSKQTTDEILNIVDKRMFANKRSYYEQAGVEDRRAMR